MFQGCFTAIVTPMHVDGEIDFAAFEQLIEWQLESGIDGLVSISGQSAQTRSKPGYAAGVLPRASVHEQRDRRVVEKKLFALSPLHSR